MVVLHAGHVLHARHVVHARLVHRRVVDQGGHAAHAVVDVVAVEAHKQHHHRWDGCPDNLQRQVAFDGGAIAEVAFDAAIANQAVAEQPHHSQKQHRADAEQHPEQLVIDGRIGAGIDRQQVDVAAHPQAREHEHHAHHNRDDRKANRQGPKPEFVHTLWRTTQSGEPPWQFVRKD